MPTEAEGERRGEAPEDPGRRHFLKLLAVGSGAVGAMAISGSLLFERVAATEDPRLMGSPADSWVMLIDLARCDGCEECTKACQATHFVPFKQTWIQVYKVVDEEGGTSFYLPRPCFNCRDAPCLKVCPVGATFQDKDGIIFVDQNRCIGCRYCMAACPYNARFFNWTEPPHTVQELSHTYSPEAPWPHRRGVVEKCMFCAHRTRNGQLPACVSKCPMGAIYFGNEKEDAVTNSLGETIPFLQTLRTQAGFRWKEELGTDPRVYYLPARR